MFIAMIILIISLALIFFAMVGYPILLIILDKIMQPKPIKKNYKFTPTVSFMIVAHNEEKVLYNKLINAISLDYPKEKFEIVVASDNSTDKTNSIVNLFIEKNPNYKIRLYCTKDHKGKTNAQNEAQKTILSEILVMTDANTILKQNAIRELVACFTSQEIVYVCGKLVYSNAEDAVTSNSEATYWNIDMKMRDIESRIQTITAGNGAIYACRNKEYIDFELIKCHDSAMPFQYGISGKRALFNPEAIAVEKAGETNEDEFKRKVRMNRIILSTLKDSVKTINFFRLKWFSFFYFGHRTCRYSLWIFHAAVFVCSIVMACMGNMFGMIMTLMQLFGIIISLCQLKKSLNNKCMRLVGYYGMTVLAQYIGVYRTITRKAKPVWEKADSTR